MRLGVILETNEIIEILFPVYNVFYSSDVDVSFFGVAPLGDPGEGRGLRGQVPAAVAHHHHPAVDVDHCKRKQHVHCKFFVTRGMLRQGLSPPWLRQLFVSSTRCFPHPQGIKHRNAHLILCSRAI